MRRFVLGMGLALVSLTVGNPVFVSLVNEFQVAPDSLERIELHSNAWSPGFPLDLHGWAVQTDAGIAVIDSGTWLESESSFTVIDRHNTTGVFDLPDTAGFIALIDPHQDTLELVRYPGDAGAGRIVRTEAWTPSAGMSASLHCWTYGWPEPVLMLDWYVDSTPTFGHENDDGLAQIRGTVLDRHSNPVSGASIHLSGPGGFETFPDWPTFEGTFQFHVGWGTFQVSATKPGYLPGMYPDSVTVNIDQQVGNIDIVLMPLGIEGGAAEPRPDRHPTIVVDILGREVADIQQDDWRSVVAPGVYFLRSAGGGKRSAVPKVIVSR
ncbi:MAG: carboxypeptidase regulatory-like domain-containing protein [candidate division WOR-3 bacterium]|nr:MAG: carboxypeptidase regulatory-like domain-containing protein [candidate division WOR-3 bacterium]